MFNIKRKEFQKFRLHRLNNVRSPKITTIWKCTKIEKIKVIKIQELLLHKILILRQSSNAANIFNFG